jgi:hypothetical protein
MQLSRYNRRALPFLLVATVAACGDDDNPALTEPNDPPAPNFVALESEPGDFLGGSGKNYRYTNADAVIKLTATDNRLSITISGDDSWFGAFQLPPGLSRIQAGTYPGMNGGFPLEDRSKGSLLWTHASQACNELSGSLTVDSATYTGAQLTAVDLQFEQKCELATGKLRGTIHWRSDDTTRAAGPIVPPPDGLWRPPVGAVPATGNYLYLASDVGDYLGSGMTFLFTGADATPIITTNRGPANVGWLGLKYPVRWEGILQTMPSLSQLEVGYYPDIGRNLVKGAMSWSGGNRSCSSMSGWFVVDRVTYSGNTPTAIEVRFEQHCERKEPAIHGALRWTQ